MSRQQRGSRIEVIHDPTPEQLADVFGREDIVHPGRVYVAGPMRGIPEFNFPAFNDATARLRAAGFEVFNPAERDIAHGFTGEGMTGLEDLNDGTIRFDLREALNDDLSWIAQHADIICLLDGWEKSVGARAEMALAAALGLRAGRVGDIENEAIQLWPAKQLLDAADFRDRTFTSDPGVAAYSDTHTTNLREDHDAVVATIDRFGFTDGETRVTSTTGGAKGKKPAAFDLIPVHPLTEVAKLYGRGAQKYAPRNWERGYDWSLSYASLMRHATQFWAGEDNDSETGLSHMASVAFHAFALIQFVRDHPEFDDRPGAAA